jgi:DNA primase
VEGYFDVLRLVLGGVEHVVAPLGTALTPDQAALLKRYTSSATLLYDSDRAGLRATFRAGDELLRHSIRVRVATLPPGEDPDSLVKGGGVGALDAVLRDSIDLFERKIQLLDGKGWFEGVDHRRDALDRLLPTIRAAADPITRELYLSLAAERSAVSKEVLEQELKSGAAAGQRGSGAVVPARRDTPGAGAGARRTRKSPETRLLVALLASPEWIPRARDEVPPSLFESPRLREVFEALLQRESPSDQMPDGLSEEAARAWSYLKEAALDPNRQDVATLYDRAAQILRARPQYREMHALADPGDKQRTRAELRAQFPAADAWYEYQKAALKETRRTRGSRGG